ncbi:PEBP-like protein [Dendrothele bispora CBS 962.96]|uniref:PEBP-like protein n=1 Tax=Dendrothele bispora (strain CBS 962.96) TaxID=1314807 RepID=A0A4S8LSI5_DENBC|nr:PEBP-like protein [Dendrothele bispora CBS 962.96]
MPTELDPEKVKEDFEKSGLVPDVVETFEPKAVLDVAFSGEESPVYVVEGGNLTVNQTALMPTFWLTYNDPSLLNQTFIVTMVDPDAPTPQNRSLAQVRHLVLADVRINGSGSEGVALLTNSTPALSEYIPPGPPAGSDPHRYTFLLWNQPPTFDRASASASFDPAAPVGFNVSQFASQNGLGQPVAGTFFFEGPDSNTGDITGATSANNGAGMRWMSGWSFLVGVVGIVLVWL